MQGTITAWFQEASQAEFRTLVKWIVSKIESILPDVTLLNCSLNGLYLLRVYLGFKEVALSQCFIVCVQLES